MYKLGWLTSCSPLYVSKLPDWKHHDALLKYLVRDHDVKIQVPIPQAGSPQMMDRVYRGDTTPLYHTLRDLDIEFFSDLDDPSIRAEILDGLVLDGLALFQDIEILCTGAKITPEAQYTYLRRLVKFMLYEKKPVIIVDNDKVCTRPFNPSEDNVLRKVFLEFRGDPNFYVFSPYDQELEGLPRCNFYHVPFEVDPDSLQEIRPLEDREFLCRYVGNNYYKSDTHIPVFEKLSHHGRVKVSGKYWTDQDMKNTPSVEYGPSITLSHDNLKSVYGDSVLGLSGASAMHDPSLYHLRWKEMLIAGVYILNEDSPYLSDKLPRQMYNFKTIRDAEDDSLAKFIDEIEENYVNLVTAQRDSAMRFFSVEKWLPVWREVLQIK